jgi:hypothetical protein
MTNWADVSNNDLLKVLALSSQTETRPLDDLRCIS